MVPTTAPCASTAADETARSAERLSLERLFEDAPALGAILHAALEELFLAQADHLHVEGSATGWRTRLRLDVGLAETRLEDDDPLPEALACLSARLRANEDDCFVWPAGTDRHLISLARADARDGRTSYVLSARGSAIAPPTLDALGLTPAQLRTVRELLDRSQGWLAIGAGSTLDGERVVRAVAQELIAPERSLISLESDAHPPLPGILQLPSTIEVARIAALDIDVVALPAIAPDATLVNLAARATTRCLVVQRVVARRPSDVLRHLLALGLSPAWLALTLPAIVMRYRLRLLCHDCREAFEGGTEPTRMNESSHPEQLGNVTRWLERSLQRRFSVGAGCTRCRGSGHVGVTDVTDIVVLDRTTCDALHAGDLEQALARVDSGARLASRLDALVDQGQAAAAEAARHLRFRY